MGSPCRFALVLALALAGCGQKQATDTTTESTIRESLAAPAPSGTLHLEAVPAEAVAPAAVSVALPQVAYTYDYELELPAKAVTPLFEKHRRACEAAGPARCQIVGAETETVGRTDTRATLTLRAETAWLTGFRSRLAGEAAGADGRIAGSKTASEDLGRAISDTGARLRALTTLQGRLEALLASRTGKLADLLETERELARVGGEIDAMRSALADMRGRVVLPRATIVYRPDSLAVAGADASDGSLAGRLYAIAANSLFLLFNLLAAVLPWALLIGVPLGLLLRQRARRRRRLDDAGAQT